MKRTALRASARLHRGRLHRGRHHRGGRSSWGGSLAVLAVAVVAAWHLGCDSTASIGAPSVKFEAIQLVTAAPLVDRGGATPERSCQVTPDDVVAGLEFAFVLKHTTPDVKKGSSGPTCDGDDERDWSIRPGDRIERRRIVPGDNITAGSFELAVDCVEAYPDSDIMGSRSCQGVEDPDFDPTRLEYRHFYDWDGDTGDLPVRCEPASIVMLIDMSGSIRGFVDPENAYREGPEGTFRLPGDEERKRVATDPANSRQSAAAWFIGDLNANDDIVVMSFRERPEGENLEVLCSVDPLPPEGELANEPEYVRHALQCFGGNRVIVTEEVKSAFGEEGGRTPLWGAVESAFELLERDDLGASRNRHIVVITDGPDTCNDSSIEWQQTGRSQCSATSYEDVYDLITQSNADPTKDPVRVHFVQLQAEGYPTRDARQMELACATQGHYQFVNGDNFTRTSSGNPPPEYGQAIEEALARVRYSLSGYWTLNAESAAFDVAPTSPGYLEPGTIYGASGTLTLLASEYLDNANIQPFDAAGDEEWGAWDLRVAFRRMCATDADCATGAPEACKWYCSPQDAMCLDAPVDHPDGAVCTTAAGEAGECCAGACQTGACTN